VAGGFENKKKKKKGAGIVSRSALSAFVV